MTRNLVHNAFGCRSDAQHRHAPSLDLRPARVLDDLGRDAEALRLGHEHQQLLLALDLDGDLGLSAALPLLQQLGLGRVRVALRGPEEGLVAGEGGVRALGGNLA